MQALARRYSTGTAITYRGIKCENCGEFGHEHEKKRVYPDDGPSGSYHYEYHCPEGE